MRKPTAIVLLTLCALLALAGVARAETTARVLASDPAGDVVILGNNQTFYLHIGYSTDQPVKIWARPFFQGREVDAGSNPSRTYTGSGEALGWFFFMEPGQQVDEFALPQEMVRGPARNSWPFFRYALPAATSLPHRRANRPG